MRLHEELVGCRAISLIRREEGISSGEAEMKRRENGVRIQEENVE